MLELLFKDDYFVAVTKPANLLVHRSWIDKDETVYALQMVRDQIGQYVYPIHRLDKPTSGVLLFALDKESAKLMAQQFSEKRVQKEYLAVVRGFCDEEGLIDYALKEVLDKMTDKKANPNKEAQEAQTAYKRLATLELPYSVGNYTQARYSLVHLQPHTGRKHQLRRHMKHILHPIVGDTKYGRSEHNRLFREHLNIHQLMLTAFRLSFEHPYTKKEIVLQAGLDSAFETMLTMFGIEKAITNFS